jgi:hypothetical protein
MSFKYACQVIDFIDEKVANNLELDMIYEEPKEDSDYALIMKEPDSDVILKKFPINNLNNCAFSYASFKKNASILSERMKKIAETNIAKRLDIYGLEHDLNADQNWKGNFYQIKKSDERKMDKLASAPQLFAFHDSLPIDTVEQLMKSASIFIKDKYKLTHKEKKEVANNLVKRASELNVEVPTDIFQYASYTPKELHGLKVAMASRFVSYPSKIKGMLEKMLGNIKTAEDTKIVLDTIEKLDKEYRVRPLQHLDPAKELFTIEKTAEELQIEKLKRALDADLFDDLIEKDTIDFLKTSSDNYFKLQPKEKVIIDTLLKRVR